MRHYSLTGKFTVKDNAQDEFVTILLKASEMLESNKDCLHYMVGTSDNPNEVYVIETWTTKQAHDDSLKPVEIQELIAQAMPLISGPPQQSELRIVGGKGL